MFLIWAPRQQGHLSWLLLSLCKQGWGPMWVEYSQASALTPLLVNTLQRAFVTVQAEWPMSEDGSLHQEWMKGDLWVLEEAKRNGRVGVPPTLPVPYDM